MKSDKKIRVGIFGAYRGKALLAYAAHEKNIVPVAVCDKYEPALAGCKRLLGEYGISGVLMTADFEEFFRVPMDAVILANYANEHAPYAIRFLEKGVHVFSEVLPAANLAQAVALVEAAERSSAVYAYGENYCYFPATREMRALYRAGKIGEFRYGEGEYLHNCVSFWPSLTYGERNHWRNRMFNTYYCSHTVGPAVHITGLRPVRVTGFELPPDRDFLEMGRMGGSFGLEMIEFSNGGIYKSAHGNVFHDKVHFRLYGTHGAMESAHGEGTVNKIRLDENHEESEYFPTFPGDEALRLHGGHGGSDFIMLHDFFEKIAGRPAGDSGVDVYEAMDMFLPGQFAFRSVLAGGAPMDIPDFRKKEDRDRYRNDEACPFPEIAGDQLMPSYRTGTPDIPEEVYDRAKAIFYGSDLLSSSKKSGDKN